MLYPLRPRRLHRHALALAASLVLSTFAGFALADPPGRVARLGYLSGEVSFSPAGEEDWDRAAINRPLGPGDRLWADRDGRAEIQLGTATLRLSANTAVSVLNLDDQATQLQLSEGSLHVRVRQLERDEFVEVDTPQLAFTLREPGVYRIDVDPDGDATTIRLREGEGEVTGEGVAVLMQAPQVQRFRGDALRDDAYASAPPPDDFDRWAIERDHAWDNSPSARYVAPGVVGYQDLDDHGSWSVDVTYGNVWAPRRVPVGWAPYRDGHWAWIDPWGWTWVDDAPWGYAVSHYGRWAYVRGRWVWVPGPVRTRAYYAPALVAFVGGDNFRLKISIGGGGSGGIGWFPLAPREVYRPAYKVSPTYFERVNVSNTVVNKTVINNVYVTKNVTHITYVNRKVPGAFVAVPQDTFKNAQPVARAVVKVDRRVIESNEAAPTAAVAPTEKAVRGPGAGAAAGKPPAKAFARPVVARTPPPPPRIAFAQQQQKLAAQPGQPLDDDERKQLRAAPAVAAAASAAAPVVKVVKKKAEQPQTLPARAAKASEAADVVQASRGSAASAPQRSASGPERRTAEGPGRERDRDRDAASAPGRTASAPAHEARRTERAARAASAAEARQRRPAGDTAPRPSRPPADGATQGAAPAGEQAAQPPRSAEERQARQAERAARRASEAEERRRGNPN